MSRAQNFLDYFFDSKHATSHGSAKFAGFWEHRKLLKRSHSGIYIANDLRLTPDRSFGHLALLAPTSSGKTTRYILNNALRKWGKHDSLIFFDPSGEVWRNAQSWLKKQNFRTIKIDLNAPESSEKINMLLLVSDKSSARMVAQSIINAIYEKDTKSDPFWAESATAILTLIILAVVRSLAPEQQTLAMVNRLVNKMGHSQDEVDALIETALNDDDFDEYASFLGNSFKVRQSILATVKSALYIYSDDVLKTICAESTFSFTNLRDEKIALFLVQDEHKISYFSAFWTLFYRFLFESLMTASEGNNVFIFADEFCNMGKISGMATIISSIRKKRVHISIIIQSFEQLVSVYNSEVARIIFENCTSKLFLNSLSHQSAEIVSQMLGNSTESYSAKGVHKRNQNLHRTARRLLTPDEVRTMKEDECLLISANYNPVLLKNVKPFYKNNTLKRRSKL